MRSTTSAATIAKLREIFATHGLPESIVCDNGPNFTSAEFENLLSKWRKTHQESPSSFEWTGGASRKSLQTPHTTGITPAELLMKRKLRPKLDLIVPNTAS